MLEWHLFSPLAAANNSDVTALEYFFNNGGGAGDGRFGFFHSENTFNFIFRVTFIIKIITILGQGKMKFPLQRTVPMMSISHQLGRIHVSWGNSKTQTFIK